VIYSHLSRLVGLHESYYWVRFGWVKYYIIKNDWAYTVNNITSSSSSKCVKKKWSKKQQQKLWLLMVNYLKLTVIVSI